jgi:hypothetical protein
MVPVKKLMSLLACVGLMIALSNLVGCGDGKDTKTTTKKEETKKEETKKEEKKGP